MGTTIFIRLARWSVSLEWVRPGEDHRCQRRAHPRPPVPRPGRSPPPAPPVLRVSLPVRAHPCNQPSRVRCCPVCGRRWPPAVAAEASVLALADRVVARWPVSRCSDGQREVPVGPRAWRRRYRLAATRAPLPRRWRQPVDSLAASPFMAADRCCMYSRRPESSDFQVARLAPRRRSPRLLVRPLKRARRSSCWTHAAADTAAERRKRHHSSARADEVRLNRL